MKVSLLVLFLVLYVMLLPNSAAQDIAGLTSFISVTGEVGGTVDQTWTFRATEDQPLSFRLEATSEGLDTALSITDATGAILVANDDYNYPASTDSLLEAITLPRSGDYTLTVTSVGGNSGEYQLTMLEGFAEVSSSTNFNGELDWQATTPEVTIQASDGRLSLDLSGPAQTSLAVNEQQSAVRDYYASVLVDVGGQDGWIVGITARQQNENYYLLQINHRGEWRFLLHQQGNDIIVRDWITHPAIIPGESVFKLGILVNGSGFEFFYNDQLFGNLQDDTLPEAGQTGLAISTVSSLIARTVAHFDDLLITMPELIEGERVLPQQLIVTTPAATIRDLQRRGLIPVGGDLSLVVSESFVESQRPGVEAISLGRGSTYADFVLGARFTPTSTSEGVTGCGVIFRSQDDSHYTLAYVDRTGGYGVSRREGDTFQAGIFGEALLNSDNTYDLLIIARGEQVLYYVDGVYRGTMTTPATEGAIGNAVVNFEPINTSCQFTNTWVWDS